MARLLATQTSYNLQIRRGADVITRIDYARNAERLRRASQPGAGNHQRARTSRWPARLDFAPQDIRAAFLAGNTTMIHLLLGLPPRYIRESPYVPTVNAVPELRAQEVGLNIHPAGDGRLRSRRRQLRRRRHHRRAALHRVADQPATMSSSSWTSAPTARSSSATPTGWWRCACSAGPAFEGAGIKCGMRAAEGAIERVDHRRRRQGTGVFGDRRRQAGRNLRIGTDLAAGRALPAGRGRPLRPLLRRLRARTHCGARRAVAAFLLAAAEQTGTGKDLLITEADLENLIRTKAAIYAACSLVLENVGLAWEAITRVYIAGGFGRYMRIADAIFIGMLPDLPLERFRYIGNSSLTGAYIALLSREHRRRLAEIASRITYVDLSSNPRYMDSYVQALFLPHTDLGQFPTVADTFESRRRKAS